MKKSILLSCALGAAALLTAGCLVLTPEQLQRVRLFFETGEELPAGELTEVYNAVWPSKLTVQGNHVKVFGKITAPHGEELPERVLLRMVSADIDAGKPYQTLGASIRVRPDGSFSIFRKFFRNYTANTLQQFLVRPEAKSIPAGSRVALCIEIVARRIDASDEDTCVPGGSQGGGGVAVEVRVSDNAFTPKSVTISPGDTVRWVFSGVNLNHTVTARDGTFDSGFAFQVNGAMFERTFPASEDGRTFEYACISHQSCCSMQGSVRVGSSAPAPDDGY